MTPMIYQYTLEGTGANGQTWSTTGTIENDPSEFGFILRQIMPDSFQQLTAGKAQYGQPGVGCKGPYSITRLEVKVRAVS